MKNIVVLAMMVLWVINIKAQRTISLREAYKYNKEEGIPEGISYAKDVNNELDKFSGIWKGTYDGKIYEFRFDKKIKFGEYDIKWDEIIGRALIKEFNGKILYDDLSVSDKNVRLFGIDFQNQTYVLNFSANSYCNDSGAIFIEIKKDNPNKMRLYFDRDKTIYNAQKCPNYSTYRTVIPENIELILTKQ